MRGTGDQQFPMLQRGVGDQQLLMLQGNNLGYIQDN